MPRTQAQAGGLLACCSTEFARSLQLLSPAGLVLLAALLVIRIHSWVASGCCQHCALQSPCGPGANLQLSLAWYYLSEIAWQAPAHTGSPCSSAPLPASRQFHYISQPVPAVAVRHSHTQLQLVSRGHTAIQLLQVACMLPGAFHQLPMAPTGSPSDSYASALVAVQGSCWQLWLLGRTTWTTTCAMSPPQPSSRGSPLVAAALAGQLFILIHAPQPPLREAVTGTTCCCIMQPLWLLYA